MSKSNANPAVSGFSLGDIAYVLFKHKWKIITVSLIGVAAALIFYFTSPPVYVSQAKLMVRYVVDRSAVDQVQNTTGFVGQVGDSVIQSEMEILTSWDLAEKVGGLPGMEELVSKSKTPATPGAVAGVIANNLSVSSIKGSNILVVTFKHPNPQLAAKTLDLLIQQYFDKHLEIHRSKEGAKLVTDKVERSRTKLRGAEDELTKLKNESGILSVTDAIVAVGNEEARAQSDLNAAESQLVEQRAKVATLEKYITGEEVPPAPAPAPAPDAKPPADASKEPAKPDAATDATAKAGPDSKSPSPAPSESGDSSAKTAPTFGRRDVAPPNGDYLNAMSTLRLLESERMQLLRTLREEHESVKDIDAKIARQQAAIEIFKQRSDEETSRRFRVELMAERAQLGAIEARVAKLRENLVAAQRNASALTLIIPKITEKERARDIEEGNYKYMSASLERAAIDEALDGSKMPNISKVQEATPAVLDVNKRNKTALAIAGGSTAGAILITLLFGLLLKRTINRPQELENRLGIPLLLTIPYFSPAEMLRLLHPKGANGSNALNRNDRLRLSLPKAKAKDADAANEANGANDPKVADEANVASDANGSSLPDAKSPDSKPLSAPSAPWERGHFIRPFSEAVRDRLGLYFEIKGITHKPKLIGVTSFSQGAGTSTVAAGLAAALSETGEGKVLMVDMTANGSEGEVHPFFAGRPALPLDDAVKTKEIQSTAADNLYLATADANAPGSGSLGLNKFRRMMRDLEASDFDYMVFDMPTLGQTSSTAAMAGLMDQVLVIVESETSSPEEVRRGFRDLMDSRAKVSVVFNKARSVGPEALIGGH